MDTLRMTANTRFRDVLDILFLTNVAGYLYLWFSGKRAFRALAEQLALGVICTVARAWVSPPNIRPC